MFHTSLCILFMLQYKWYWKCIFVFSVESSYVFIYRNNMFQLMINNSFSDIYCTYLFKYAFWDMIPNLTSSHPHLYKTKFTMPIISFLIELRIYLDPFCVNVFWTYLQNKHLRLRERYIKTKNDKKNFVDIIIKLSPPPPPPNKQTNKQTN